MDKEEIYSRPHYFQNPKITHKPLATPSLVNKPFLPNPFRLFRKDNKVAIS